MEQKMSDNFSNPNIEWKKTGFGTTEKLSLKINAREADVYNAKKKNAIQNTSPLTPADLPAGLKKLRRKIKDVFDEEEDDDENSVIVSAVPSLQDNYSLLNALNEDEKKILEQQDNIHQIKMQQDAAKLDLLEKANELVQETGLKGLQPQTVNDGMLRPSVDDKFLKTLVKSDLSKALRLKDSGIPDGHYIQVLRGIKNIRKAGGLKAMEGLNLQQVAQATDEKKAAQILLEKTGRDSARKTKAQKSKQAKNRTNRPRKNLSLHLLGEKSVYKK